MEVARYVSQQHTNTRILRVLQWHTTMDIVTQKSEGRWIHGWVQATEAGFSVFRGHSDYHHCHPGSIQGLAICLISYNFSTRALEERK
jgi:hypothetical protein